MVGIGRGREEGGPHTTILLQSLPPSKENKFLNIIQKKRNSSISINER